MKAENAEYIANHPEFRVYLDEFTAAVLTQKPKVRKCKTKQSSNIDHIFQDIVQFGASYFGGLLEKQASNELVRYDNNLHLLPMILALFTFILVDLFATSRCCWALWGWERNSG